MTMLNVVQVLKVTLLSGVIAATASPAIAQNRVEGKLQVKGTAYPITQVYAYAQEGFFDKSKLDVTLLFCDGAVPPAVVRDEFALPKLIDDGKLHCVLQVVSADKQVSHFEVLGKGFGRIQGASSEHIFDAKTFDGKTAAGRSRTKSPQMTMMDKTPYNYDLTFSAAIDPKK